MTWPHCGCTEKLPAPEGHKQGGRGYLYRAVDLERAARTKSKKLWLQDLRFGLSVRRTGNVLSVRRAGGTARWAGREQVR